MFEVVNVKCSGQPNRRDDSLPRGIQILKRWLTEKIRGLRSLRFGLSRPCAGDRGARHFLPLEGWVSWWRDRIVRIEIGGEAGLQHLPVKTLLPGMARFRGHISALGLSCQGKLAVLAVRKSGAKERIATIRYRRTPLAVGPAPALQPLMLLGFGRSGTTWTMRLLREHPAIAVAGDFPYEVRAAQFWLRWLHLLSRPTSPWSSLRPELDWLGDDPRLTSELPPAAFQGEAEQLAVACRSQIDRFYRHAVPVPEENIGGTGEPPVRRYFAEKMRSRTTAALMEEVYREGRQLFLVRDFRDIYCSARAFNAKRGYLDFGQQRGQSAEDHIRVVAAGAVGFYRRWQERKERAHLVRYEDLVLRPQEALAEVFRFLGLDTPPSAIQQMVERASRKSEQTESHRTSTSTEQSVGRWRRELSAKHQQLFRDLAGEVLDGLGYETDGRRLAA